MNNARASAPPGRPRDEAKHAAVIAAARRLFVERGFADTSIEQVAAAAGVSKVTIYSRFRDKPGLFAAVVRDAVSGMNSESESEAMADRSIEERLVAFGVPLFNFLLSGDLIAFQRIMVHEAPRVPELAARVFESGPGFKRAQLAEMIAGAHARGEVEVDDPLRAAEDLLALWKGFHDIEMHFGLAKPLEAEAVEERIRRGVRLWLKAHAPIRGEAPRSG